MAQALFVAGFTGADDHQLQGHGQNFVGHVEQKVNALLIAQAANHAEQRKFRIDLQAELSLQSRFIGGLAFTPVLQSIILTEGTVGRWVVTQAVDTIQNPADFPALSAEDAIQPFPVVIHHNFFSIAGRNRGHTVTEGYARLQEIGHSVLKNRRFIHVFFRQIKEIQDALAAMNSLKFEIVNGQNTAEIFVIIMRFVMSFQSHGNHAGLPVIEVQNIRFKAHGFTQSFQNRPLEKAEAFDIESIVQVNSIMAEVVLIVDQIDRHAHDIHLKKACIHGSPAHVNH